MIVMTYNLREGAPDKTDELVDLVRRIGPDLVCVQEANGWDAHDQHRAREFAQRTGLVNWTVGRGGTRFLLGTFAALPLSDVHVHTAGLWHCAIQATVQYDGRPVEVWNVHLNPRSEDARLAEAHRLSGLIGSRHEALVVGDLNSLTAADRYPQAVVEQFRAQGITKFGPRGVRFDVTEFLRRQGLVDLAASHGAATWTVPTLSNTDVHHGARLRLDYALATVGLAERVSGVRVVYDGVTEWLSDHYPLVVTLAPSSQVMRGV